MSAVADVLAIRTPSWMDRSACAGADPALFFPEAKGNAASEAARRICSACPVKAECEQFAIANQIDLGVWGGRGPHARQKLRSVTGVNTCRLQGCDEITPRTENARRYYCSDEHAEIARRATKQAAEEKRHAS